MEAEDSQDSSSSLKRPRCPNWTEQDKVVLVRNIQLRREIIMSKNKGENAIREAAWQEILAAVNEEAHFPRTLEQVKKQYENLKMRARQVYNDIVQCKGAVKPHILSPATELMIDLFKQETNMSTGTSSMMLFDDCSISTPGFTQFTKKKSTTPQPILPKPPPTATIITTATPTSLSKTPVSTTSSYEESPDWNTNGGSGTYFSDKDFRHSQHILDSDQTGYTTSAKRLKSTDTRLESNLIQQFEIERIQAETQRHKAETELIYQRRECEFAIFEMKSKVLQAKLEYYRSNKMIKPKIEVTSDDDNDTS